MADPEQYPFTSHDSALGEAALRPYLPLALSYQGQALTSEGLLDTGAAVNVLPYHIGLALGAVWEAQTTPLSLTGNLAQHHARLLFLQATVGAFAPVRLAFAWTQATQVPMLLGQINFFMEFDVCFFRSRHLFEIQPKVPE